jgi:hypothetical protein
MLVRSVMVVGFDFLTAMTLKSAVVLDVTPCRAVEVHDVSE